MSKEEILKLRSEGLTYSEIGKMFGVSRQRIHQFITGYKSPSQKLTKNYGLEYWKYQEIKLGQRKKFIQEKIKEAKEKVTNRDTLLQSRRENIQEIIKKSIEKGKSISSITGIKQGSRDRIRELVRIRDNHTCQDCGKVWQIGQRRFDVHHLDEEFDGKTFQLPVNEVDRNNVERMITLCHRCHLNLDITKRKISVGMVQYLQKKLST